MRYLINYQIKISNDQDANEVIRSSYTILEEEVKKFDLSITQKVENWFEGLFEEKPLDLFIDQRKAKFGYENWKNN